MSKAKVTPWFAAGTKPARAGVYRIRWRVVSWHFSDQWVEGYAYWSRRLGWRQGDCTTPKEAFRRKNYPHSARDLNPNFSPLWRGIANKGEPR